MKRLTRPLFGLAVLGLAFSAAAAPAPKPDSPHDLCQNEAAVAGYDTRPFIEGFDIVEMLYPADGGERADLIRERLVPRISAGDLSFGLCPWRYALVDLTGDGLKDVIIESAATSYGAAPGGVRRYYAFHLVRDGAWEEILDATALMIATRPAEGGRPDVALIHRGSHDLYAWDGHRLELLRSVPMSTQPAKSPE